MNDGSLLREPCPTDPPSAPTPAARRRATRSRGPRCRASSQAVTATALVGAIGEALVGPLSPPHAETAVDALVARLIPFCLRSTTDQELSEDVHRRAA